MKAASGQLITLLATNDRFLMADLFTVTLLDSTVFRWTSADVDVVFGGNTFSAQGPLIRRGKTRTVIDLEVDTLELTLLRGGSLTFLGLPMPVAAANGAFDGARVKLERVFMPVWGDTSAGSVQLFEGNVAGVDPSSTEVRLHVKSELERLNVPMPHTVYQPQCSHALYDAGCGVSKAAFTVTGTINAGATLTTIPTSRAEASEYFTLGVIAMTSGTAAGSRRAVKAFASGLFTLALPLPVAPAAGDGYSVYPGCDKKQTTCNTKFANLTRFRGFPYIPRPETAR